MDVFKKLFLLAACGLLTACAGSNFVKPTDDKVVLGATSKAQVSQLMGSPMGQGQKVVNGQTIDTVTYGYANVGGEAALPGVTAVRMMSFLFFKDVLVGKEFVSSFKADSSLFDFEKAKTVKQGMKRSDVLALLGTPTSEFRYPVVASENGKGIGYQFSQTKGFKSQINILMVELDDKDVVTKVDYTQNGQL